ncbi:hypothetical protein M011DRAFT_413478 [Sporormia fimetaria CBS 119925]|uniref:Alpha N-terminal protein methyltransferase 1 n=1 Tax=Sporormia fimetaria CBS 119925 TaxID=1340428 RepID=A0A6A6UWY1_9PLEO|nr:hypothetical protein M011DRAFT_413478 [Sporormia fimetaria CBS 119925]
MTVDPPLDSNADAAINHDDALSYWNSVSSDVNGMLGGFPQTSRIDLLGSRNFLTKLRRKYSPGKQALPPLRRVADCGAGIGRITKGLLMQVADQVDVVEPVKKFTDELIASVQEAGAEEQKAKLGHIFNAGLQDWVPEPGAYDLIWNQWCLGHLTDAQLVAYLVRCRDGLRRGDVGEPNKNAYIVVKENLSTDIWQKDIFDAEDSSVTRSDEKFRKLFKEADLTLVDTELQKGFPKELFPVRVYALRPM